MLSGDRHHGRFIAAALVGWLVGCAEGGTFGSASGGGAGCTPGISVGCACPGGVMGSQICAADGSSFLPCECTGGTGQPEASGSGSEGGAGSGDAADTTAGLPGPAVCGDGVEEDGECDPGDPTFCPEDCGPVAGSSGDPCDAAPTLFGSVPGVGSRWEHMGFVGFAAGDAMCQAMGADHVCDYEEVLDAEMKGELAGFAVGTTAWLHRTTMADTSLGTPSAAGLGGRCVDWTYTTNHLADGEYLEFTAGGLVYHIDDDTFYDGTATEHAQTDQLQCGNQARSVLCCHPVCQ